MTHIGYLRAGTIYVPQGSGRNVAPSDVYVHIDVMHEGRGSIAYAKSLLDANHIFSPGTEIEVRDIADLPENLQEKARALSASIRGSYAKRS